MRVDSVVTLDNGINYLLLDKAVYNESVYFMAVVLNEEEEPTEEYVVLKETIEDNDIYAKIVDDPNILKELIEMFTASLKDAVDSLPNVE